MHVCIKLAEIYMYRYNDCIYPVISIHISAETPLLYVLYMFAGTVVGVIILMMMTLMVSLMYVILMAIFIIYRRRKRQELNRKKGRNISLGICVYIAHIRCTGIYYMFQCTHAMITIMYIARNHFGVYMFWVLNNSWKVTTAINLCICGSLVIYFSADVQKAYSVCVCVSVCMAVTLISWRSLKLSIHRSVQYRHRVRQHLNSFRFLS